MAALEVRLVSPPLAPAGRAGDPLSPTSGTATWRCPWGAVVAAGCGRVSSPRRCPRTRCAPAVCGDLYSPAVPREVSGDPGEGSGRGVPWGAGATHPSPLGKEGALEFIILRGDSNARDEHGLGVLVKSPVPRS